MDVYGKPLASDPTTVQQLQTELQQVQEEEATEGATAQLQAQQQQLEEQLQIAETPAGDPRLVNLEQEIAKQSDVQAVSPAATDTEGTAAVFSVTPKTAPQALLDAGPGRSSA